MKADRARLLKKQAVNVAEKFSDPNRAGNINQESFTVAGITPLSEDVASVTYLKSSGKLALSIWYYVVGYSKWVNFFPTDSHILGFKKFDELKQQVEVQNWSKHLNSASKDC